MDFAANVTLVDSCEGIPWLVGWQEPGKPCRCALFVFWPPLRRTRLTGDLRVIEAGLVRGAARAVHNVDHSRVQFVQRLG